MGMQGEKKATMVAKVGTTTYGPYEAVKATGRKLTAASSAKRNGAGQARNLRVGAESVENGTYTFESDGTIPFKTVFWPQRRQVVWSITETPGDEFGNPRAGDADNFTAKLVGLSPTDVDVENDEDLDYIDAEFILKRA